jgi:hypothetical protein
MTRKTIVLLAVLALGAALFGTIAIADNTGVIIIDKAQAKKPPVAFPHKAHQEKNDCVVCHHTAVDGTDPESCFNCHGKDPDISDPSQMSAKKNPFHIKCKGCHTEVAKGPTKCKECHKG